MGEDGGINLLMFLENNPLSRVDYLGEDIYLMTGNDSWNPVNNLLHQSIGVDTWDPETCESTGRRCFSFGQIGFGWNSGKTTWLGYNSWTLPGYLGKGMIYEASEVEGATIVKQKQTNKKEDACWLKEMEGRVGETDVYSVGRHNCRNFSQCAFENAPGEVK